MRARSLQHGLALAEFAIVSGLLFLILFGIVEFSVALFDQATITNASREGARTGILFRPDPRNLGAEDTQIRQVVNDYAQAHLISLGGAAAMNVQIARNLGADGALTVGDPVTVTIAYPYRFLVLPGFIAGMTNLNIRATSVMRAE
jgi:Flp pilus assembly protein TadG